MWKIAFKLPIMRRCIEQGRKLCYTVTQVKSRRYVDGKGRFPRNGRGEYAAANEAGAEDAAGHAENAGGTGRQNLFRFGGRRRRHSEVNGKRELITLTIDPEAVDPDDVEMLQDMVVAAVNEALRMAEEATEQEMGKLTGGLGMPGLF